MKTTRTLIAMLLVTTAFAALATPPAAAHYCEAEDPANECGSCRDLVPHHHRYTNGGTYCTSWPLCLGRVCIKLHENLP